MSETSRWDDYFKRVSSYLESGDIESEELNYKREIARQLARHRETLLARTEPISLSSKDFGNLGSNWRVLTPFVEWLSTDEGSDALRELWAHDQPGRAAGTQVDVVIGRVRAFSQRLAQGLKGTTTSGSGTWMRPISVLLMALDAERFPPFQTRHFTRTYRVVDYPPPPKGADEATLYDHAIRFLDRFIAEAGKRGFAAPGNRLEAQSLLWALAGNRDADASEQEPESPESERKDGDRSGGEALGRDPASSLQALAGELLLPVEFLRKIETLLDDKRQVIFQGPPGTGKTYAARALAGCLAGKKERVRLVQFHPSYSYEDFVLARVGAMAERVRDLRLEAGRVRTAA